VPYFREAMLIELPDALATVPGAAEEARFLHDAQMLRNRLARNVEAVREACDRCGAMLTKAPHQSQAGLVGQGRE
jgi:hypothetical protein